MDAKSVRNTILGQGSSSPVFNLCIILIDFVSSLPHDQREMLTYKNFARATSKASLDKELLAAVSILSTSDLKVLDAHALFVDDNEFEYEIELSEFMEARRSGKFIHPKTGNPVPDFETKIFPFFTPSAGFGE